MALPTNDPGVAEDRPDPDPAWKALTLVNEWIRHAESKATAILAFAGISAGVLYDLVKDQSHPSVLLSIAATVCTLAIVAAAGAGLVGLAPRLRSQHQAQQPINGDGAGDPTDNPSNLLFFSHIARDYKGDASTYAQVFGSLSSNPAELTRLVSHQLHANADVAQRKYQLANFAIVALGIGLIALAFTAVLVAHA